MNKFKMNFKNRYQENDLLCKLGCSHPDSQDNMLKCEVIIEQSPYKLDDKCYANIFGRNVSLVKQAAETLSMARDIREDILNPVIDDDN